MSLTAIAPASNSGARKNNLKEAARDFQLSFTAQSIEL